MIVMIHGGFWRSRYDLSHAGHFCAALTAAGFPTANIEYRRTGEPGGGWPGTFEDLRSAFRYVSQIAQRRFSVPRVVARVLDPRRAAWYAEQGLQTICPTQIAIEQLEQAALVEA